jgi:hypothetical protein
MAASSFTDKESEGLRITGIKEPIRCIEANDGSRGWMGAIEVIGLVPAFKPGGYVDTYVIELVSSDDKVLTSGILSQAPDAGGTSTTVAIGKVGAPAGEYVVRVSGNGEEAVFRISAPDCLSQPPKSSPTNNNLLQGQSRTTSEPKVIKDVYLEESSDKALLTVESSDGTKCSAILKGSSINELDIDNPTINKIRNALDMWKQNKVKFAQDYLETERTESEFLHDVVALARYISRLPPSCGNLLRFKEASILMHNRIMAQLMDQYHSVGLDINPTPSNYIGDKRHDFNVSLFGCEVKTIQPLGSIQHRSLGGFKFKPHFEATLLSSIIYNKLEEAREQVGGDGIVILAPWSYNINAILTCVFERHLLLFPPAPESNTTILVLTSERSFTDYYVAFQTDKVVPIINNAFSNIQAFGVSNMTLVFGRDGLPIQFSTAPRPGSRAGASYDMPQEETEE